jgi:hypothetical protein
VGREYAAGKYASHEGYYLSGLCDESASEAQYACHYSHCYDENAECAHELRVLYSNSDAKLAKKADGWMSVGFYY